MRARWPLILDRYVASRVINPFAQGIAMFWGLLLALDVVRASLDYLSAGGTPLATVKFFFLACPQYLILSLPMAMLFAGIFTFSQFSSDLELTATCAAGFPFRRLIVPVLAFAAGVSLFSFYVSEVIAPWCNRQVADMKAKTAPGGDSSGLTNRTWRALDDNGRVKMLVYASEFDPAASALRGITVLRYEREEDGAVREIYLTVADTATYAGRGLWQLESASTRQTLSDRPIVSHESEIQLYRASTDIVRGSVGPRTMTIGMLKEEIAHLAPLIGEDDDARKVYLTDRTELALRFAVPLACLIFAMAGCPMGVRPERATRGMSYGLSFGIILLYYILINYMTRLGNAGSVPPWFAAWFANLVLGAVGVALILRVPQ